VCVSLERAVRVGKVKRVTPDSRTDRNLEPKPATPKLTFKLTFIGVSGPWVRSLAAWSFRLRKFSKLTPTILHVIPLSQLNYPRQKRLTSKWASPEFSNFENICKVCCKYLIKSQLSKTATLETHKSSVSLPEIWLERFLQNLLQSLVKRSWIHLKILQNISCKYFSKYQELYQKLSVRYLVKSQADVLRFKNSRYFLPLHTPSRFPISRT